mmetsp:Transcript_101745/g.296691  ORF Transcript_101745/g.296691 Transcript_101745/m.296691 type:complete len:200 (+) Transcript_101745:143-742(+)
MWQGAELSDGRLHNGLGSGHFLLHQAQQGLKVQVCHPDHLHAQVACGMQALGDPREVRAPLVGRRRVQHQLAQNIDFLLCRDQHGGEGLHNEGVDKVVVEQAIEFSAPAKLLEQVRRAGVLRDALLLDQPPGQGRQLCSHRCLGFLSNGHEATPSKLLTAVPAQQLNELWQVLPVFLQTQQGPDNAAGINTLSGLGLQA